ncbi:TonB family protein [Flavobacterium sp. XGLA_31]|uniref:TonB family protein n=1 Tax=Flavobacterium sp. XGLA_31 TaxID=3447666 RepID=UPI003F3AB31F
MKIKILFLFILFSNQITAQEPTDKISYLDSLGNVATEDKYFTKKVVKDYNLEKPAYKYLEYYSNGNLKSEKTLSGKDGGFPIGEEVLYYENGNKKAIFSYEERKLKGLSKKWHENGKLKEEGFYDSEKLGTDNYYKISNYWDQKGNQTVIDGNGNCETSNESYTENGAYKNGYKEGDWYGKGTKKSLGTYHESYENGHFVYGVLTDETGTTFNYKVLEKKPEPKKGLADFYQYIGNHFSYTNKAIRNKIKGKLYLKFIIDKEGKITEVSIIKGLGYGLDEEAIRVVSSYENWIPGEQKGRKVRCQYSLPITVNAEN